ncbi:MAG: undecaprenyl-diphosphate phosphatase [Candidatus Dadabacteria bacterium]|nr:undecaprenyl-diphosphate phosphatase [Candidatus Dadabacteria bacterium]
MEKIEIAVLGIVQGITEFFPVSSTAHMMIVSWLFSWEDAGLRTAVWLHAGTLASILFCFRKDWMKVARGLARAGARGSLDSPEARMGAGLLVTVLPSVAAGLAFEHLVAGALRQPQAVVAGLVAGSAALFLADRKPREGKRLRDVSIRDCLVIGVAQAFALAPGVSRAGASISGGMFLGYTREESAKFAFMMGVPAIGAAIGRTAWNNGFALPDGGDAAGAVIAAAAGVFAVRFLMRFARRGGYMPFVAYRMAVALALLAFFV